jgi:hypothetical protein
MLSKKKGIKEQFDYFPLPYDKTDEGTLKGFTEIEKYYDKFKKLKYSIDLANATYEMVMITLDNTIHELAYLIGRQVLEDPVLVKESLSFRTLIKETLKVNPDSYEAKKYLFYFGTLVIKN